MMSSQTEKSTAEEDSDIIEFLNRKLANLTVHSDATEVLGSNDGLPFCEVSTLVRVLIITTIFSHIISSFVFSYLLNGVLYLLLATTILTGNFICSSF